MGSDYGKQTGRPVTHELPTPAGGVRLETFVPWTLVRRGLKKRVITPMDAPPEFLSAPRRAREAQAAVQDSALMRALGLAHHWMRRLDEERTASVAEIAKAEGMDVAQVRRVMRLTAAAGNSKLESGRSQRQFLWHRPGSSLLPKAIPF
jgi:hypothetical protein